MKPLYTAIVTVSGGRDGKAHAAEPALDLALATPKQLGGPGGAGTNPEQLFAAGYAACFHNGMRLVAGQQKVKLGESTVRSTVSLIALDNGGFSLKVALSAHLPGLDQPTADRLVEATHQVCPYSKATRGNISVTLEATV